MNFKKLTKVFPLLVLFVFNFYPVFSLINISDDSDNKINYIPEDSGIIIFKENSFQASKIYFGIYEEDHYLMIQNFYYGSKKWTFIGLRVEPTSANITIVSINKNKINYVVNAPSSTKSITQLYVLKGRPSEIIGASSWDYYSLITEIKVTHNSPQEIEVRWSPFPVHTWVSDQIHTMTLLGSSLTLMVVGLVFVALYGGEISLEEVITICAFAISIPLVIYVIFISTQGL